MDEIMQKIIEERIWQMRNQGYKVVEKGNGDIGIYEKPDDMLLKDFDELKEKYNV